MGQITLPGNPSVPVIVRRSKRARRISLRLSHLDGRVTLTVPPRIAESEALAFLHQKADWVRGHLDRQLAPVLVGPGAVLPIHGQDRSIAVATGRRFVVQRDVLQVPGPAETLPTRLRAWLKEEARRHLAAASDDYAAALGKPYSKITLRDTRSRWGSCTTAGALMYSWRLIFAPPDVLSYVAAHEVAHLRHMDHSPAFWDTVRDLFGDWEPQRRWLREHGAGLHRFRFDP